MLSALLGEEEGESRRGGAALSLAVLRLPQCKALSDMRIVSDGS